MLCCALTPLPPMVPYVSRSLSIYHRYENLGLSMVIGVTGFQCPPRGHALFALFAEVRLGITRRGFHLMELIGGGGRFVSHTFMNYLFKKPIPILPTIHTRSVLSRERKNIGGGYGVTFH